MKKENKLKYILPENRTVRIVLAVFFWLLAAAWMHILAFEP